MDMKRILFFSMLMAMAISVSYASDFNAVSTSGHTLYYNIIDATAHTVSVTYPGSSSSLWTGYTKPTGNIVIPSSVSNGGISYSVVAIGDRAFFNCDSITGITFPNTIQSIGNYSFSACYSMSSVTIPNSVKRIGEECFATGYLSSMNVPNSVEWMGAYAFGNINQYSGYSWDDNLSDGVVYLGKIAYIYKGVVPTNTSITLALDTKGIAGKAFSQQSNITSISLPSSLLSIGEKAFYGCGGIQSVTIPTSVKKIGYMAFEQCGALTTVNYNATDAVPFGDTYSSSMYFRLFIGCDNFTTLNFGSSVQVIPEGLFRNCTHIYGQIVLPASTRKIGNYAFNGCTGITSVTIPANVDTIENAPFYGCTSLSTVYFNATNCRSNYYSSPFMGCTSLSSIVIGSGVQTIPDYLCYNLTSLNGTLSLPNNLQKIGSYAFSGCTGINGSLTIPNNVRRICTYAFRDCTGITAVTLGTNLDTLETGAFSGTSSISSITYKATNCTNEQANWMFTGNAITSLSINSNVQSIPDCFIGTCPNLTTVNFPSGISRIGVNNFYNCGLTGTLTLPSSITEIGYGSFTLCSGLSGIQCNASTPPTVPPMYGTSYIFTNCWNIPLYVPCSSVSAYQNAPGWSNFTNISGIGGCSYTVTLSVNNSAMGSVSGGGTYTQGATATISATPNNGYHFDHWSDGNTQNPRTITVTQDVSLTAYFVQDEVQTYTVTVFSNNTTMGTVTGGGTYEQGTTVQISAIPNNGYHFDHWSDGNTQNPRNITVNSNITLTAYFVQNTQYYTVTLSSNDYTMGTVTGGGTYEQGTTVQISAIPNNGYHFDHWSDGNTQNPRNITVNSNITLTAYFVQNTHYYTVTLSSNDYSMGTVTGGGQYEQGTTATCAAVPYNGYHFVQWSDNNTQNPRSIIVNNNISLTAYFAANTGIEDVDNSGIIVYAKDNQIHIDEAIGEKISVYSIDGRTIASLPRATEHVTIPVVAGIYIVKIGDHPARKVVMIR